MVVLEALMHASRISSGRRAGPDIARARNDPRGKTAKLQFSMPAVLNASSSRNERLIPPLPSEQIAKRKGRPPMH